jgi:DNA-binding protein H-NS
MTKTYTQIQKQIAALQREADKLKRQEVDDVISRIKEAITVYGLSASDLGLGAAARGRKAVAKPGRKRRGAKAAAVAKFRDDAGNTWGGRGPRPQWLRNALAAGKNLQDFAV